MTSSSTFLVRPSAKLTVSLLLVAVYCLLGWLPPLVTSPHGEAAGGFARPLSLGVGPFLVGFLLIELFSLTPWGRRQRESGLEGRQRLNRWGLKMGLLVAFLRGLATASTASPELGERFLVLLTVMAGSVAALALAHWISVWGLGNGFCWLVLVDLVYDLVPGPGSTVKVLENVLPVWLVLALICGFLVIFERRRRSYEVVGEDGETRDVTLPAFPQSLAPVTWAASAWFWLRPEGDLQNTPMDFFANVVLVAAGAVVGFYFFSTRRRVEYNLDSKLEEGFAAISRRELAVSTAVLLVGVSADRFWWMAFNRGWIDLDVLPINVIGVLSLVFIGLDLFDEWTFSKRHGEVVTVVELDNVHLASWLRSELEARDVPAMIRTFRYRSLWFMLGPLYKMSLLVPAPWVAKAEEVFAEKDPRVV